MRTSASLVALILALGFAYWLYRGMLVFRLALEDFAPTPDARDAAMLESAQAAAKMARVVTLTLADGSRQRAFYLAPRNGALIVYAHGAPGAGHGLLPEALAMAEHGFGALLPDLPGYGASEGARNWNRQFSAALRRAVDFAVEQPEVHARRIGGFGYSLGGYAMARAASEDPRIAALVLLATFADYSEQLRYQFRSRIPGVPRFAVAAALGSGLPVGEMDTRLHLRRLGGRPVLVIAGSHDGAIPREAPFELARAAANAELWVAEGVGHAGFGTLAGATYYERLRRFWTSSLLADSRAPDR